MGCKCTADLALWSSPNRTWPKARCPKQPLTSTAVDTGASSCSCGWELHSPCPPFCAAAAAEAATADPPACPSSSGLSPSLTASPAPSGRAQSLRPVAGTVPGVAGAGGAGVPPATASPSPLGLVDRPLGVTGAPTVLRPTGVRSSPSPSPAPCRPWAWACPCHELRLFLPVAPGGGVAGRGPLLSLRPPGPPPTPAMMELCAPLLPRAPDARLAAACASPHALHAPAPPSSYRVGTPAAGRARVGGPQRGRPLPPPAPPPPLLPLLLRPPPGVLPCPGRPRPRTGLCRGVKGGADTAIGRPLAEEVEGGGAAAAAAPAAPSTPAPSAPPAKTPRGEGEGGPGAGEGLPGTAAPRSGVEGAKPPPSAAPAPAAPRGASAVPASPSATACSRCRVAVAAAASAAACLPAATRRFSSAISAASVACPMCVWMGTRVRCV